MENDDRPNWPLLIASYVAVLVVLAGIAYAVIVI
jgi:hypothetical protein